MKPTISLVAALVLIAPAAHAQTTEPVSKRAVFSSASPTRAKAVTERISTNEIVKEFFVAYGGEVGISFQLRSDGVNETLYRVELGHTSSPCEGSTTSSNYLSFSCADKITSGEIARLVVNPQGTGAVKAVRLKFDLVDMNAPAVTLRD